MDLLRLTARLKLNERFAFTWRVDIDSCCQTMPSISTSGTLLWPCDTLVSVEVSTHFSLIKFRNLPMILDSNTNNWTLSLVMRISKFCVWCRAEPCSCQSLLMCDLESLAISWCKDLIECCVVCRPRGRQVLDYESICCLLVLLFVDDSRLNTARLHRVFRNLCYHPPTRDWVIRVSH